MSTSKKSRAKSNIEKSVREQVRTEEQALRERKTHDHARVHKIERTMKAKVKLLIAEMNIAGHPIPKEVSDLAELLEHEPEGKNQVSKQDSLRDDLERGMEIKEKLDPLIEVGGSLYEEWGKKGEKKKLQERLKDVVSTAFREYVIDTAMEKDMKVPDTQIVSTATSPQCIDAFGEFTKLKEHFNYFVVDGMDWIHDTCDDAMWVTGKVQEWEGDAKNSNIAAMILEKAFGLLKKIPSVKTLFEALEKGAKWAKDAFDKIQKKLEKFHENYGEDIESKATDLQRENFVLAIKMQVRFHHVSIFC